MRPNTVKGWERATGLIRKQAPLKERIAHSLYRLKVQQNRLEGAAMRMQQHDRNLFEKCVAAQASKDSSRAAMYANECAEVRKMQKIILRAALALEQVILRLESVQEFGDVVVAMAPVAGVVKSLQSQLSGVIPEVSYELGRIGEDLGKIVIEFGETTGTGWEIEATGEAQRILEEASAIAEQKMKERFPEIPAVMEPTEKVGEAMKK
ncbi:MAG: Snf7 family protein [Candidatus Bathyarchaeia archaeon]